MSALNETPMKSIGARHRRFRSREEAARLLVGLLKHVPLVNPTVLSIPNGGVPIGRLVAEGLSCPHNIALVRKIVSARNPNFTLGAVSEFGDIRLNDDLYGWEENYESEAQSEAQKAIDSLLAKRQEFGPYLPRPEIEDRDIVLVDDGVMTGETLLEAYRLVRLHAPRLVVAAVPVVSRHGAERLRAEGLDFVAIEQVKGLETLTEHYESFPKLGDKDVVELLKVSPRS